MTRRPKTPSPRYPLPDHPSWDCPAVPIGSPTGKDGWFSNPIDDPTLPEIEPLPLPPVDWDNLPPLVENRKKKKNA